MKKRILCFVLVMLMIFVTLPLSVFAEEGDEASGKNPPPVVSVSSRNPYPESDSGELGALPNKDGKFYFNIFLENIPTNYTEEVVVYYRTVDDSAVAKWGDYESVGFDASVTLTKDNDYTATVSVTSTVIDSGFYTDGKDGKPNEEKIISRRFIFELTSVAEDKFELSENNSKIYCYLRADVYNYQSNMGDMFGAKGNPVSRDLKEHFENFSSKPGSYWYEAVKENYYNAYEDLAEKIKYFSIYKTISGASALSTPRLQNGKQTSYRDSINLNFDEEWQNYVQSGWCDLGISIKGTITRKFWDSDGDTEFNLYYNIGGEKKLAMTLYLEGEFDDSTFFGWERAFEYLIDGNTLDNREDHVEDNFIGFTVYDNDGNVAYSVKNNGNIADIRNQLNTTLIQGNSARQAYETFSAYGRTRGDFLDEHYYLRMPSNFALADSYSYEFISRSTDDDEIRWLEDVMLSFTLMGNKDPIIEKDENNAQLVTTNLDTIKEGDRIRMSVRFDRPVHIADPNGNCYIIADICDNKGEVLANDVKLTLTQVGGTADNHYAWDTLVFESEKSIYELGLDGKKIASVRSISLHDGSEDDSTEGIKSFLSERKISNKTIDNIYVSRDFGTPVVSVSPENSNGSWIKSKSIKVSVYNKEDKGRFNDYVTVYYQWSDDSNDTFTTYSSKLTFHYREDGEAEKQIIETGSGEMYLHVKAVSSYGKSSDPLCFGPYKFDNDPPIMSAGYKSLGGTLKERALTVEVPKDDSDVRTMELYYVSKNGEGVLLKSFNINGQTSINCVIKHSEVKVGVGVEGAVVPDRQEISFYWRVTDTLGNVSEKSGEFKLVFDTNQYINTELDGAADYGDSDVKFATYTTEFGESFIYDYSDNKLADDKFPTYKETDKKVYYGFSFVMNETASNEVEYGAVVAYKGNDLKEDAYTVEKISDTAYVVWLHQRVESGRYDVHLTNGDSVSQVYSVYVTDGEKDTTAIKNKVEFGTLLSNKVYQLSSEYPNFYYKDKDGNIKTEYYTGTKNPATFSSYDKAKEYVYYRELSDIYLVQLSAETATALSGNAGGYQMADGETKEPEAGQCWIRYKRSSWTPTSGEGAWAYYYYGMSNVLNEDALPANLLKALNDVSKRIAGYGKTVILTDTSLFLGYVSGDKMLDSYGMPYLLPGQIYVNDELTARTKCENTWVNQVAFAADKNIYKSIVSIGEEGTENYREYPIVGSFTLPEDSIFQYKREENSTWTTLNIEKGKSFVDVFNASGVYYIREISVDGVSVYSIYIDKAAPDASFYKTNESGGFEEIPVNQKEILTITTKDLYLGSIDSVECDKQSYIAVYKASNFSLVATYTFGDLENTYIRLEDGNYYIVVSDRSGNHYTINAKVSSTPLECEIKETTNKNIKVTCNRNANQILRYEIYLNGELVTSTYSADQSFTDSGEYNIYIQDIYGNIFTRTYTFTRSYPTVTWKYCGADGKFHAYDSKDTNINGFTCKQISENQYKIDTAVKTRFSYIGEYEYEFIGVEPECEEKSDGSEIWVTIEEGQSFTVKIYYAKDEDCYVIYSGVVDVTPPSIKVSAETDVLLNGEYGLFDEWLKKGNEGDVITMKDLYYKLSSTTQRSVSNGGTTSSDIIRINVSDVNELSLIEVYCDGELIKSQDTKSGFSQIIVSRWGSYKVVAKDALGNVSEFNFTNRVFDGVSYFVDGVKNDIELHGSFTEVDGRYVYSKINYGNKDFKLDISKDGNVFLSVGVSGGNTEIYGFKIFDGKLYPLSYKIVNGEIDLVAGDAILDISAKTFKVGQEYLISKEGAYAVYASIGTDKTVSIKVYASEDTSKILSVSARMELGESNTMFVSSEISKKLSYVSFTEGGVQSNSNIYVNNRFSIDESTFESECISSVSVYYSKLNDLDASNLAGKTNIYAANKEYEDEGFYLVIVRNLYGNERVYKIAISKGFGVTSSVTFADGQKVFYSIDYKGTLYSNGEITLDILEKDITISVTLNGALYKGFVQKKEGDITYLVFSEAGKYVVELTDSYGNKITRQLEINKSTYTLDDKLLTGYNEKALKRNEGYTNQKLSVDKDVYDRSGIYYLAIQYGDTLNVLFDAFAESPIITDKQKLANVIGANGDGVYKVICRNRYGAVVTKEIHYRATPTLKLERTTRSQSEPEAYDLSRALSLGFWSNNILSFSTDAKTYVFTINGSATECPKALVFEGEGDAGSFEYVITYIDEYGFEYSFKAYLVRKNLDVNISPEVGATEIDGILSTKKDIFVTFAENAYATYVRNNGEEVTYKSGDVLKKDGTYRFTVTDYAGNATTVTIKKDTAVEFSFVDSVGGSILQSGSVVNSSKISFKDLNKDGAYIEKVIHNGVIQSDFSGSKFTEDGKWELIVCDKLGNRAYFSFYIITCAQNGFAYTTPYEYRITEMWYDSGDGVKVSYLSFVNQNDTNSSFNFVENGKYTVVMTSDVTGMTSTFEFTVNTSAPEVSLVGCGNGETTINDITFDGYKIGDVIRIYRETKTGEELVEEIKITSLSTKIPTVTEGGKYRVVVESEAGVQTELSFVRKHVMNTAGSIFIIVIIAISVIGLFTGLVYRNKSKTDD